ncbi:hypothetical protein [Cellulomonas sp. PhB150]|uniref:hypothetical protein n=1 Tax=Cellulomonas sp. PhB150 TaxID=2485188 RepID=UPI000F487E27|nr:hypothetical protein [Cellulomonas sp. PhB150]ROS23083.1 hypothetical protein EDF34_3259 [Cellulomonas sp. PhB150]
MARRPRRRRRSALRAFVAVAIVLVLLLGTVVGVVAVLNSQSPPRPQTEVCFAGEGSDQVALSPTQAKNAALISAVTIRRGLPARAATIGLATAMQESRLVNIDYGDRDSIGLFQQRPSQGWGTVEEIMDPVYSTGKFFDHLVKVDGYEDLPITEAAQAVQRSGFPDAYAQHEPRARAFASALTGYSEASLRCELHDAEPGTGDPDAVVARVKRDFGKVPTKVAAPADGATTVTIDAGALGDDDARMAWAVAQWAVATAAELGTTSVEVADQRWDRDSTDWSPGTTDLPVGTVRLALVGD